MNKFRLFPEQASTLAPQVDALTLFLLLVSAFFTLLIAGAIIFFAIRYRAKPGRRAEPTRTYMPLEIAWTLIPAAITVVMFVWGAKLFMNMVGEAPPDALVVNVIGRQWMWKVQHPEGRREINELHIPVGQAVELRMTSEDVVHSFFIPAFRTKMDVVPGRYTRQWFRAEKVGEYRLFCAQYCGTKHAGMNGKVIVMEAEQYQQWLAGAAAEDRVEFAGRKLFESQQLGCITCHASIAPTLAGLYGGEDLLADGTKVKVDDNYLRESILRPNEKIVAGYKPGAMPSFEGRLTEEQLMQLISYIKSLKDAKTERGNR